MNINKLYDNKGCEERKKACMMLLMSFVSMHPVSKHPVHDGMRPIMDQMLLKVD